MTEICFIVGGALFCILALPKVALLLPVAVGWMVY